MPLQILRQSLTKMKVDAIVNSTNEKMIGYSGVDLAIHTLAGEGLDEECKTLPPLAPGGVAITSGYDLPCRYIFHTVGPVYEGGGKGEAETLRACYRECLSLAVKMNLSTIAFPLISGGNHGFPKDQVLSFAVSVITDFLLEAELTVYLCVYDRQSYSFSKKLFYDIVDYITEEEERRLEEAMPFCANLDASFDPPISRRVRRKQLEATPDVCADKSLEDFLKSSDKGFRERLFDYIDRSGMTDVECYKRANLDKRTFSKIKSGKGYRPSKQTVVALAIALRLTLDETQELLSTVGLTLSRSGTFDMIIRYFLHQGNYNIFEINEALFEFDQLLLGST